MYSQEELIGIIIRSHGGRGLRVTLAALLLFTGGATSALAYEDVAFKDLGGDQCFKFSQLVPRRAEGDKIAELPLELVINNEEEYRKLFDPHSLRQSCVGIDPSRAIVNVDFSLETVLGLWNTGSCAARGFRKRIVRDDKQKTIIYSVSVIASPISCSGPGLESLNLIAIPKVAAGYKIVFERISE
jgi:hypothetical protein